MSFAQRETQSCRLRDEGADVVRSKKLKSRMKSGVPPRTFAPTARARFFHPEAFSPMSERV